MPETVKKGEDFDVEVTFNNPLSEQLTDCTVGYESGGFQHKSEITQDKYVMLYILTHYNNPLNEPLTDGRVGYESGEFQHKSDITQDKYVNHDDTVP